MNNSAKVTLWIPSVLSDFQQWSLSNEWSPPEPKVGHPFEFLFLFFYSYVGVVGEKLIYMQYP